LGVSGRKIHPTAVLDANLRLLSGCVESSFASREPTILPATCDIGPYCVIGAGVRLGERVVIDSYVSIDPGTTVGDDTIVIYRAAIGGGVSIGASCVIGGFIPENTKIGNRARILGTLTHLHENAAMDWDHHTVPEPAPVIDDDVFVGLGALIIGGVHIARKAYVCAGATVTTDVPEKHIVSRSGKIVYYEEWRGRLRSSPFFEG
jgi:UDP-3-O-[3-hydroxymyristoyl] glucosamine N-acyltransferase